jgi:hypothetical protein
MDTSEVSGGLAHRWSVNLGNTGIAWDRTKAEQNVVFLLFFCSQTTELAGRCRAHGDLKPIHCLCFAKISILSMCVNSVNFFLSEAFSNWDTGRVVRRTWLISEVDLLGGFKWGTSFISSISSFAQ